VFARRNLGPLRGCTANKIRLKVAANAITRQHHVQHAIMKHRTNVRTKPEAVGQRWYFEAASVVGLGKTSVSPPAEAMAHGLVGSSQFIFVRHSFLWRWLRAEGPDHSTFVYRPRYCPEIRSRRGSAITKSYS